MEIEQKSLSYMANEKMLDFTELSNQEQKQKPWSRGLCHLDLFISVFYLYILFANTRNTFKR